MRHHKEAWKWKCKLVFILIQLSKLYGAGGVKFHLKTLILKPSYDFTFNPGNIYKTCITTKVVLITPNFSVTSVQTWNLYGNIASNLWLHLENNPCYHLRGLFY